MKRSRRFAEVRRHEKRCQFEQSRSDSLGVICGHSRKAIQLVREFVGILEKIPDGCAELFPFELIDELKEEYLTEASE